MSDTKRLLLKTALRAAECGDSESAAEALRSVIAMTKETPPAGERRAVTKAAFAAIIACTPEHVAHLIKRGEIPADAVLGVGRGQRVLVDAAIAALRGKTTRVSSPSDSIEAAGAAYVRRRCQLRIVRGRDDTDRCRGRD